MKNLLIIILASILMTSCALQYMDWPSSSEVDHWIKSGQSRNNVSDFYFNICGFKTDYDLTKEDKNISGKKLSEKLELILISAEKCMLKNGYNYDDKPEGFIESKNGGRCRWSEMQYYPSCQSIKK